MSSVTANELLDILRRRGPMLSSDLVGQLLASGVSPTAARQRVSRSKEPIRRLEDVRFPHNERFIYLKEHERTAAYYRAFLDAAERTNSAYGVCLRALMVRGGVCPAHSFDVLSGCPITSTQHVSSAKVRENLLAIGAIRYGAKLGPEGTGIVLHDEIRSPIGISLVRARLVAETVALGALREWLKKLGFVSYNKATIRGEDPVFASFRFDLVGPSYLRPLASITKKKLQPGFLVADIHLGHEMDLPGIGYFLRKTAILRSAGSNRAFLALLICDKFSHDALRQGRAPGILLATPAALFGDDVAEALRDLVGVLANVAEASTRDPDIVNDLFSRLSRIEGASGNIRGPLFEFLTAHIVTAKFSSSSVDVGRTITASELQKSAEIDILHVLKGQSRVEVYECRGHEPGHVVSLSDVQKWCCERIPIVRAWLLEHPDYSSLRHRFNYWTTGAFSPDAAGFLTSARNRTKVYEIAWLDGEGVVEEARLVHAAAAVKALNEHYVRHPIATSLAASANPSPRQ